MEWTAPQVAISQIPDLSDTRLYLQVVEELVNERDLLWAWTIAATYSRIDTAFRQPPSPERWAKVAGISLAELRVHLDELVGRRLLNPDYSVPHGALKTGSMGRATVYAELLRSAGPPVRTQLDIFEDRGDL